LGGKCWGNSRNGIGEDIVWNSIGPKKGKNPKRRGLRSKRRRKEGRRTTKTAKKKKTNTE